MNEQTLEETYLHIGSKCGIVIAAIERSHLRQFRSIEKLKTYVNIIIINSDINKYLNF